MRKFYPFLIFAVFVVWAGCVKKSPTSPGAGNWVEVTAHAPFSGRYGLSGTVFNGSMWVVGGASGNSDSSVTYYYGDVWSSSNGSSWSEKNANAPFGGRYGSQVLSYNGKLWLIGGNNSGTLKNDVWSSSDGVTWTQVLSAGAPSATQFSSREDFGAVVFNNAMWVIGGFGTGAPANKNDVWTSTDGVNWTQVLANAPFAGRWGLAALVYNNAIWVMGGATAITPNSDPTQAYGDVWTSPDGSSWTKVSNVLNPTYFHQVVANNNQMWWTAGFLWNNWGSQNDVVTSSDGISWPETFAPFPPRFYHLSLSYGNQVWVIAGCNDRCTSASGCAVTYLNDVWRTQ